MASNTNVTGFIPEIFDATVYRTLEDNLIGKKICRNYTNKVSNFGDVIHFDGLADPTVNSYGGTVSYDDLASGRTTLSIDQQNYYAFNVTDVEQTMANVDLKGSQAERAGYVLRKACDTYILKLYGQTANTVITDTSCDTSTIFSDIGLVKQKLAENNVDENNAWIVIPPWVQLKLELAGIVFSVNQGINGKGGMMWAKVLGLDVYVTNQVYDSSTTPVSEIMAGSYDAIVFAEALMKSEDLRAETAFKTRLRGLHVFDAKVIKPKEIVNLQLTYVGETGI